MVATCNSDGTPCPNVTMFGPADTNLSPYDDLGLWRAFEVPFVIGLLFLFISGFSDRLSSWGRGSIVIFTLLILMEIVAGWMTADRAKWCSTMYGYCASLSCMAAQWFEWQVFLALLFLVNFLVTVNSTLRLAQIRALRDANPENLCTGKLLPNFAYLCELLMRVGSALSMITGIIPSYASPEALCKSEDRSDCTVDRIASLHSLAIFAGVGMILAGCIVRMVLSAVQYCRRAQWKPISDDTYGWAAWRSIHFGGVPAPHNLAAWLAPLDLLTIPVFGVLTVIGFYFYVAIDGTTPWFPRLQICFTHLHEVECLHPGFGSTPEEEWPCEWDATAKPPYSYPCRNNACGQWARTNAFSILYETHGLFFGMMLLHVSLARMERVEAYYATPAFLAKRVALEARGTHYDGRQGVARAYDASRYVYEVELTGDGGDDGPKLVSVIPDQLRLSKASGKVGPA